MLLSLVRVVGPGALATAQTDYRELLCSYPWDCAKAYRVMMCESTGNPNAYSAGNIGLMQINTVHSGMVGGDPSVLYDPETNVRIAYSLYEARGWQPWGYCGGR